MHGLCVKCGMNIKTDTGADTASKPALAMKKSMTAAASTSSNSNNNNNAWIMQAPSKQLNLKPSVLTLSGGSQLHINSSVEAGRIENIKINALMGAKKLALVLDLDHTLVHAVQVQGRYRASTNAAQHVNAVAGKEQPRFIEHHFLPIEETIGSQVSHLAMKKRPHLDEFLSQAFEFCQMTVYTAGTRRYAEAVAKIIDPQGKFFANRLVSRSDVSTTSSGADKRRVDTSEKSLDKIFMGDSVDMAVIIDDREDVWQRPASGRSESQVNQLLLVRPYIYFTGPGVVDANNSSGATASVDAQRQEAPVISLSGSFAFAFASFASVSALPLFLLCLCLCLCPCFYLCLFFLFFLF
jgi:FCP1-like phosphatase family protein